jgi:hypothetical protein
MPTSVGFFFACFFLTISFSDSSREDDAGDDAAGLFQLFQLVPPPWNKVFRMQVVDL